MMTKAMALLLSACMAVLAQGPLSDTITVNFPHMTRVGDQTLPAGEYQIRQLPTASNPRLLEFSSNSGTKLEAAITTIAALDNNNQNETSVILEQQGGEYFLKYIWIQGKSYGYEIPAGKTRTATASPKTMRMTAAYSPAAEPQTVAQLEPQRQSQPSAPEATASPTTDTVPESQPAPQEVAPSAVPQQDPTPTPDPVPQSSPTGTRASRDYADLPDTASNLAEIALTGLALAVVGLLIRRFNRIAL